MRKVKNLSNKLMAILISASMVFAPVVQSMPVYAAEPIIEEGSAGTLPDNAATDESAADNNDSDTPDAENGDSDDLGTEDGDTENPEKPEVTDSEDGDSNDQGDTEAEASLNEDVVPQEDLEAVVVMAAGSTTSTISEMTAKGWNESIYAEVSGIKAADVAEVSYSGDTNGKLSEADLQYLVRDKGDIVRIDIPGLKKDGTYSLTVKALSGSIKTVNSIKVYGYDRSGYAHFNYTSGVGAYNDDGTLKDNTVVLYVTDENKNDVELTVGKKTVKGIGNILNSAGKNDNGNDDIIKELAKAGKPLVVRFIGTVSESGLYSNGTWSASAEGQIKGLTAYKSTKYGGGSKDNGHLARIKAGKDITLEGIGTDAVIDGWGFHYIAEGDYGRSFEVRNLTFINTAEDAVGMEGQQDSNGLITPSVERCWIHNNEFYCPHIEDPAETDKAEGDGSVDFKRGQYLTCSYNYFEGCHKTNLVGSDKDTYQYNLSYHHNYYYRCGSRGPLSRNANIHMYNNVYEQQTSYAMNARASAYIFAEYNLFYAARDPQIIKNVDDGDGTIKSYKDSFSSILWKSGNKEDISIVDDKTTYVENNCQYAAAGIKYDKFDITSSQSYIPDGNYELQTDFMKMRAVLASQLGVQKANPIPVAEITPDNYSMVVKNSTEIKEITLPFSAAPGKISQDTYAFKVDVPFNISVEYGSTTGILVNDAGENLLEGSGECKNLPAGRYMIQPANIDLAKTGSEIWKECKIDSIEIEECNHICTWVEDTTQYKAATCTVKGKRVYKCADSTCGKTKEEEIPPTGHSYEWVIDKEATETEAGAKHEECSVCHDKKESVTIPALGGGGTGGGDTGIVTKPGDHVLNFEGKKEVDPDNFFDVSNEYTNSLGSATIEGKLYKDGLKLNSKAYVNFNCNKGATLTLVFGATYSGKTVKVDGKAQTIAADGIIVLSGLTAGSHSITRGDTELGLLYVVVSNPASEVNKYTVTLDYNDGSSRDAIEIEADENKKYETMSELVPSTFTKNDYILEGLYTDTDCNAKVAFPYIVTKNVTLYAKWVAETKYKIVYDPGNASSSGDFASVFAEANDEITLPACEAVEGYTFTGWSVDGVTPIAGGKYTVNPENASPDKVITITALYSAIEYNIAYDPDGGTLPAQGLPQKGKTGQTLTLGDCTPANPATHSFAGWSVGNSEPLKEYIVKPTDAVNGTITLKAVYRKKTVVYTIKFDANGGSLPSDLSDMSLEAGTKIDLSSYKPTSDGKRFIGWQINDVELDGSVYTVNAEDADANKTITIKALYKTEYTVNFETGEGTLPSGMVSGNKYIEGETVTLGECILAETSENRFDGWYIKDPQTLIKTFFYTVDPDDADPTTKTITITAKYVSKDAKTYTVTLDLDGGTLDDGSAPASLEYTEGSMFDEEAKKDGYKFSGWTLNGEKITTPYPITEDVTLKAEYEKDEEGPSHEGIAIVGLEETYEFTGAKIIPNIAVVDYDIKGDDGKYGRVLSPGVDYTVRYANNSKLTSESKKDATITVTGKGNYAGKDTQATFKIVEPKPTDAELVDLKGSKLKIKDVNITYNGKEQHPAIELTLKKEAAVTYTYDETDKVYKANGVAIGAKVSLSNNINKGTATILLTGKNGTNGKATSVKKTFKIAAVDISKGLNVDATAGTYAVKGAKLESITVKYGDKTLRNGVDYTVKYTSNKKAGEKGNIVITGKGNYTKKFTTAPKNNIQQLDLAGTADNNPIKAVQVYDGLKAGKVKATVVDKDGNALKPAQYTLKVYTKNDDEYTECRASAELKAKDTIYVEATAKDTTNLKGTTAKAEYTVGNNIAKAKFVLNKVNGKAFTAQYSGQPIELKATDLTVTIKEKGSNKTLTLEKGTHYEIVSYSNNINKGTATAVIKGINDYSGTKTVKFKIVGKKMEIGEGNINIPWKEIPSQFKSFMNGIIN